VGCDIVPLPVAGHGKLCPVEIIYRILATAIAVWVATFLPGVDLLAASTPAQVGTLIGVAIVFGLVNLIIKPIVKVVGCVLYLITFGLFGLVVNGLLFWFASWLSGKFGLPFHVDGFWAGFFGAIVVAIVGFVLTIPLHVHALRNRSRAER
jgi:putative membrane protein